MRKREQDARFRISQYFVIITKFHLSYIYMFCYYHGKQDEPGISKRCSEPPDSSGKSQSGVQ